MYKEKILITGASGAFGKHTIDFLLKKGIAAGNIVALIRSPEKGQELKEKGITVKIGDYDNYQSLVDAFQEIDKLLLVSGTDHNLRSEQHDNVVNAAKESGVKHVVYTSVERKNETSSSPLIMLLASHLYTEKVIKESGIPYTILRNPLYLDFVPVILGDKVRETGVFYPAGETKAGPALRSEMAEVAANILATEGHENKEYSMSNSDQVSFKDIAKILTEVFGKKISYISPDLGFYKDALVMNGVPPDFVDAIAGFAEAIRQGELLPEKTDLEDLLGRKPTTVKEFLKQAYSQPVSG
ncbi:SDR family oxidoreductase [Pedobacter caeni]|uniref:NAD(P)H dehydrogenase (Quinone) n=1 Tax=Pedobacter caeni TaxID=288992 RepID=A0A1M4W5I4_9SPHI|nr:SDR family oxidoreductase [Pedobacter caeni]SHE76405.1 NAD(P)H dehydrogenase (quinone) [Pedobacter caeni]